MINYIYTISCPFTNHVVYVGITTRPEERFKQHCSKGSGSLISMWCLALKSIGSLPLYKIIDNDSDGKCGYSKERNWIRYFKDRAQANFNKGSCGTLVVTNHWIKRPLELEIADLKSIEAIKMTISPFKRLTPQQQEK